MKIKMPLVVVVAFLGFLFSLVAQADPDPPATAELFKYRGTHSGPGSKQLQREGLRRSITVDLKALEKDPTSFRFKLPTGETFQVFRTSSWSLKDGSRHWSGEAHQDGRLEATPDGFLSLTLTNGHLSGSLQLGNQTFEILPTAKGRQELVEVLATSSESAVGESTCAQIVEEEAHADLAGLETKAVDPPGDGGGGGGAITTIDVLVVYPSVYLESSLQHSQLRSRIADSFAQANNVFINSGVNARYRQVFVGPLTGQPPVGSVVEALSWLTTDPAEVVGLRNSYGADLVLLFIPGDQTVTCGAARGNNLTKPYAVIESTCSTADYLVAHELGHILGLQHSKQEMNNAASYYPNGYGYDNDNNLRINGARAASVMACNGNNNGTVAANNLYGNQCNRLPYFSSPATFVGGMVLGTPTVNNAQVARERASTVAALRSATGANVAPTIAIERPQGSYLQRNRGVTLKALAWDGEEADISSRIQWISSRRGPLGTGASLRSTFSTLGTEVITARVVDARGQQASASRTFTVAANVDPVGGIWHNPSRLGEFLSFNKNSNNDWVAAFLTHESGAPTWYLSNTGALSSTGGFSADLLKFSRNVATGALTGAVNGTLALDLETDRQLRVSFFGMKGGISFLLEPLTSGSGISGTYWGITSEGTVDPGWGIIRGTALFDPSGNTEVRVTVAFDGTQPTWVIGTGVQPPGFFPYFDIIMRYLTPSSSTPMTSNYNFLLPEFFRAGGAMIYQPLGGGTATATLSLRFPSGNVWNRTNVPLSRSTIR